MSADGNWDPWLEENQNAARDPRSGALTINHDDGSITIDLDPKLANYDDTAEKPGKDENLVGKLSQTDLAVISSELLDGIAADDASRSEWLQARAKTIEYLGLKVDPPKSDVGGSTVEGLSSIRHPILLEAVLRGQANARGELLPTDGPVKVRNDATDEAYFGDAEADALEKDLNHYLTAVATEYYPDTNRMLFQVMAGGAGFKKVYHCPIRNRPVSESVDAKDLIVSDTATDLANAGRITHRIRMRKSTLRRMQLLGEYADIELGTPTQKTNVVDDKEASTLGVSATKTRTEDADYTILECYCELDIPGYEHKVDGKPSGLPLPYRVSIEETSREILQIVPNYDEGEDGMPTARETFVLYPYVEGLGFYPIGLGHILGNTAVAATASWRLLLDAGMFSNFPGFLYLQTASGRQLTNTFRVPPGGGAAIEGNSGDNINQRVMPLPYKEPSPTLMQLTSDIVGAGQRVGSTSDQPVGEGNQNAPVGTTLALIEQATKVESAVHKGLHAAQAKEFQLLKRLFKEDPEALFRHTNRANLKSEQLVRQALNNCDLVPQADPNTHSRMHRLMKEAGLLQLNQALPGQLNQQELAKRCLTIMQVGDPNALMAVPQGPQAPPVDPYKMGMLELKKGDQAIALKRLAAEGENNNAKRQADQNMKLLQLASEIAVHPEAEPQVEGVISRVPGMLPQYSPTGTLQ